MENKIVAITEAVNRLFTEKHELQPFIDEVLPNPKEDEVSASECIEVVISVEDYLI